VGIKGLTKLYLSKVVVKFGMHDEILFILSCLASTTRSVYHQT